MRNEIPLANQTWTFAHGHVTFAKFALIEIGMTREEVEKIITRDGSDTGEPVNIADTQNLRDTAVPEFSILYRQGQGAGHARITYRGTNPSRVIAKSQLGLF